MPVLAKPFVLAAACRPGGNNGAINGSTAGSTPCGEDHVLLNPKRDRKSSVEPPDVRWVERPAPPHQPSLSDRRDVVAVDDALAVQAVVSAQRHLGGMASHGGRDERDGHTRENRDRFVACEHHAWTPPNARKLHVPDVTAPDAVHSRSALLASLRASRVQLNSLNQELSTRFAKEWVLGEARVA